MTSNSDNFSMTRNDVCIDALRTAGIVGLEQTVPAPMIALASQKLNMLVKHWENSGIHIWTQAHATVFLVPGQATYTLGTSGDRATNTLVQTSLSATKAAGQTILSCASVTGMSVADNIGIVLDSNITQWTTVSSIDTVNLTVTIASSLSSNASSGAVVYSYTSNISRPLKITSATIRNSSLSERMLGNPMGREDYYNLPLKNTAGTIVQIYYDPTRDVTGTLYVYQPPTYANETLQIEYRRSIQDFDSATDTPDLPQTWYLALVYNLAILLCPSYGKEQKKQSLKPEAEQYLAEANDADFEEGSINFIPESH